MSKIVQINIEFYLSNVFLYHNFHKINKNLKCYANIINKIYNNIIVNSLIIKKKIISLHCNIHVKFTL